MNKKLLAAAMLSGAMAIDASAAMMLFNDGMQNAAHSRALNASRHELAENSMYTGWTTAEAEGQNDGARATYSLSLDAAKAGWSACDRDGRLREPRSNAYVRRDGKKERVRQQTYTISTTPSFSYSLLLNRLYGGMDCLLDKVTIMNPVAAMLVRYPTSASAMPPQIDLLEDDEGSLCANALRHESFASSDKDENEDKFKEVISKEACAKLREDMRGDKILCYPFNNGFETYAVLGASSLAVLIVIIVGQKACKLHKDKGENMAGLSSTLTFDDESGTEKRVTVDPKTGKPVAIFGVRVSKESRGKAEAGHNLI
jgi:hypothetical protein